MQAHVRIPGTIVLAPGTAPEIVSAIAVRGVKVRFQVRFRLRAYLFSGYILLILDARKHSALNSDRDAAPQAPHEKKLTRIWRSRDPRNANSRCF